MKGLLTGKVGKSRPDPFGGMWGGWKIKGKRETGGSRWGAGLSEPEDKFHLICAGPSSWHLGTRSKIFSITNANPSGLEVESHCMPLRGSFATLGLSFPISRS